MRTRKIGRGFSSLQECLPILILGRILLLIVVMSSTNGLALTSGIPEVQKTNESGETPREEQAGSQKLQEFARRIAKAQNTMASESAAKKSVSAKDTELTAGMGPDVNKVNTAPTKPPYTLLTLKGYTIPEIPPPVDGTFDPDIKTEFDEEILRWLSPRVQYLKEQDKNGWSIFDSPEKDKIIESQKRRTLTLREGEIRALWNKAENTVVRRKEVKKQAIKAEEKIAKIKMGENNQHDEIEKLLKDAMDSIDEQALRFPLLKEYRITSEEYWRVARSSEYTTVQKDKEVLKLWGRAMLDSFEVKKSDGKHMVTNNVRFLFMPFPDGIKYKVNNVSEDVFQKRIGHNLRSDPKNDRFYKIALSFAHYTGSGNEVVSDVASERRAMNVANEKAIRTIAETTKIDEIRIRLAYLYMPIDEVDVAEWEVGKIVVSDNWVEIFESEKRKVSMADHMVRAKDINPQRKWWLP